MLPDLAAGIGQAIGESVRLREEQQPRVVVDERAQDHELGLDPVVRAVRPIIRRADDAAAVVAVDAIAHRAGDQLEIAGRVGLGQLGDEDARFGPDMAAEGLAKAAIGAARPPLIVPREDRTRCRKRVMAELKGRVAKDDARLVVAQRRQWIVATPRRFEHIAAGDLVALHIAGLARDPELVFGAVVVGLQIGIAQWPVRQRGILRDRRDAVALDRVRTSGSRLHESATTRRRSEPSRRLPDCRSSAPGAGWRAHWHWAAR